MSISLKVAVQAILPQPWPADAEWVPLTDTSWNPLRAVSGNARPRCVDITSGGQRRHIGPYESGFLFFRASTGTLYHRVLLSDTPFRRGRYRRARWGVLIDTDGDGFADWGALVTGLQPGAPAVKVMYSRVGTRDNILDVEVWSGSADPAAGFTRVVPGPVTPDGLETYYLDWQTPLAVYRSADPEAPPPLTEKSCARFFFATGTSAVTFDKDFIVGPTISFTPVLGVCVDGLPEGRRGRLYDTRDPDPPSGQGEWAPGETVVVQGAFWCKVAVSLPVRILDPSLDEVFEGALPVVAGAVPPAPTWTVPPGTPPGVYTLEAADPRDAGPEPRWRTYDRFAVAHVAPEVELIEPDGGELWRGTRTITWSASSPQGFPLTYDLSYSVDGGTTFLPLASGLETTSYEWDTTLVPSSDRCLIRVTASDGVRTASDTSQAVFTVDNDPPKVGIIRPAEGETVSGEVTVKVDAVDNIQVAEVRIYAGPVPLATLPAPPYEVVWDTTVEANAPVTLRAVATDLVGLTAESTVRVTVRNTGAVSGRVTDRASGLPLAGAAVTLLSGPLLPVATTTTDEDGLYSFDDVLTGSYLVRASAAGYGVEAVGAVVEAGLTAGVDLALEPQPGAVSGTVRAAGTGRPLAGATVRAVHEGVLAAEGVTDAAGRYLLEGLAAGWYLVTASHEHHQSSSVGAAVRPGQTTTVDFSLQPDPATIQGTVTEMDGGPILGATVSLHDSAGLLVGQTVTGADGTYRFQGVAPGTYLVTVRAAGFSVQAKGAFPDAGEEVTVDFSLTALRGRLCGRVTDAATGLPVADVLVTAVDPTGVAAGRAVTGPDGRYLIEDLAPESYVVTFTEPAYQNLTLGAVVRPGQTVMLDAALAPQPASVSGTVTSAATGRPLAGARVVVMDQAGIHVTTVLTDGAGRYEVEGLAAGSYTLLFQAADFRSERTGVSLDPGDAVVVDQALEPDPGALRGTVTDAVTGEPLAGAAAVLRTAAGVPVGSALTDDRGVFLLPGLAPSPNYKLTVTRSDYASEALSVAVTAGQTTEVAVALEPQPGRVTGTVTRAATGRPLPGVEVLAFTSGGVPAGRSVTGPDGRYLVEGLAPGSYELSYNLGGFAERTVGVVLEPAQEAVVDVTLTADPGNISGLVTDASTGRPLEGVEVKVYDSGDVLEATVLTDPAGRYEIPGRRPDAYTLVFALEGFGTTQAGALVGPGETVEVDVRLTPGAGWVRITVLDQDTGLPLAGAEVVIRDTDGTIVATLLTAADGLAAAELGPGEYTAVARARFYAPATVGFTVAAGQTTVFTMELDPGFGFIRGTVLSAETGEPLAEASVRFFDADGVPVAEVLSDPQGEFCSGPLASGSHFVVARRDGFADAVLSVVVTVGETRAVELRLGSLPGRVSGTVTDAATGEPLAGANVRLLYRTLIPIGTVVTEPGGRYLFDTLQPGSYSLVFRAPGYQARVIGLTIRGPGQGVVVDAGLEKPPSGVKGRVVAADTGRPIPGAAVLVALSGSEPVVVVRADAEGYYVVTGLAPRPYLLTASAVGRADQVRGAAPGPGETATVDFALWPSAGAVKGQVTDAETGEPVAGAAVSILTADNLRVAEVATSSRGVYRTPGLSPGRYFLVFSGPGYAARSRSVTAEAGAETVVDAALEPDPGVVEGCVTDARTGEPLVAEIAAKDAAGAVIVCVPAAGTGLYRLERLRGTYTVQFTRPGYVSETRTVTVAAGEVVELDLALRPLEAVKVRSAEAEVTEVRSDLVHPGLVCLSAGLQVDLIYLPRGSDRLALARRRSSFDRLLEVPTDAPGDLVEAEARVLRTSARVRSSGVVDVVVTVLLRVCMKDLPDVEETTVVTVVVDPSEQERLV
ncbi:MAG TPA: hypothetical protein DHW14_00640 [Clostridiales bacterium]|nr:hypothetical protein [Clostridiales bacterium]